MLKFAPFNTIVSPNFWHKLKHIKLNDDKLNDDPKAIWGFYTYFSNTFEVDSTAFNRELQHENFVCQTKGVFVNTNTSEAFKAMDKDALIETEGARMWEHVQSGACLDNPALLNPFVMITFADLKKFKFYYMFGFPAVRTLLLPLDDSNNPVGILNDGNFTHDKVKCLYENFQRLPSHHKSHFIVIAHPEFKVLTLREFAETTLKIDLNTTYFAFIDGNVSENKSNPTWTARNYLAMIIKRFETYDTTINLLAVRLTRRLNQIDATQSVIFRVKTPPTCDDLFPRTNKSHFVGWQKNAKNQITSRVCDLSKTLDPMQIAASSVDLNLKLMKWRLLPDLDLNKLQSFKCLLIGAGTLGCAVARNLLAWGVKHITFVDNGRVSYSNPVRQSLFVFDDCANGGRFKAHAAADALKRIYPNVVTFSHVMHIPMPSHPVNRDSVLFTETKTCVETLEELIQTHDAIFLLTDSRESRWLPTVLAAFYRKLVINAALGFDSYLVMRHGFDGRGKTLNLNTLDAIPGDQLGCYFCSDVNAPGNSTTDRTLDQQCTVTRPGCATMAASIAVEFLVAILHHVEHGRAKAFHKDVPESPNETPSSPLGIIPHTLRGFLHSYLHVTPAMPKFTNCIACSDAVLDEFERRRFEFLMDVFESGVCLEVVSGLDKLKGDACAVEDGMFSMSDSDEASQ